MYTLHLSDVEIAALSDAIGFALNLAPRGDNPMTNLTPAHVEALSAIEDRIVEARG